MSDKPISEGDLVCVVKWPCCGLNIGKIGTISNIDHHRATFCVQCGERIMLLPNADFPDLGPYSLACVPVAWLRRIPPLSDLTGTSKDARKPVKETA